jgi:hypothetical protein
MVEIAPLVPPEIVKVFKYTFNKPEYKKISWPEETNGLEAITVYKEIDETLFPSRGGDDTSDIESNSESPKTGESKKGAKKAAAPVTRIPSLSNLIKTKLPTNALELLEKPPLPNVSQILQKPPTLPAVSLDALPVQSLTSMFNGGQLSPTLGHVMNLVPPTTAVSTTPQAPQPEEVTLYMPDEEEAVATAAPTKTTS